MIINLLGPQVITFQIFGMERKKKGKITWISSPTSFYSLFKCHSQLLSELLFYQVRQSIL